MNQQELDEIKTRAQGWPVDLEKPSSYPSYLAKVQADVLKLLAENKRLTDKLEEYNACFAHMFYVCGERYNSGTGRLSRTWIMDHNPLDEDGGDGKAPYPFNGMGGVIVAGPFDTEDAAKDAEDKAWDSND